MIRPGTSLRQAVTRPAGATGGSAGSLRIPKFEELLAKSDWVGASAVLELEKTGLSTETSLWQAYCAFHLGEYRRAQGIYEELLRRPKPEKSLHLYKALCLYAQSSFDEARGELQKFSEGPLANRLAYVLAQKRKDDASLMAAHKNLSESVPDQLAMAAVHFLRAHYDDSVEIYKRVLQQNKKNLAVHVYLAICYYRQDYFEMSIDSVRTYLNSQPDSVFATSLLACNLFQTQSGEDAEREIRKLEKKYEGGSLCEEHDLLRHNISVFRNGENALKVFPPLIDEYPEARLNLTIHYLRSGDIDQAFKTIADLEPSQPREYMLKAVTLASYAQAKNAPDVLAKAQQLYQIVGTSADECDTVPGRQCISSFLFLKKQFDDALIYLRTIREFLAQDDVFNWNYGIALAATGKWAEAEEALSAVTSDLFKSDFVFIAWFAKSLIMNGKPDLAWNLYLDMDTSNDTLTLLNILGNEYFKQEFYYYALKAFDILERLDNEDHTEAKLASAVGVFKDFLIHKEASDQEHLEETVQILKSHGGRSHKYDMVLKAIQNYIRVAD